VRIFFATLVSLTLAASAFAGDDAAPKEQPKEGEKKKEEGPNFKVDTSASSKTVKVGEAGQLAIHIQPLNGTKVHPDAPLSVKLSAPEGLAVDSKKLGRKNVKDKKAKDPVLETGVTGKTKGKQEVTADLTFFLCTDTACDRVKQQVKVAVEVTE